MTPDPGLIQGFDPRTGEPAGEPVGSLSLSAVTQAVDEASEAFEQWRGFDRAAALDAIAAKLDGHVDELVEAADRETALGRTRLAGEVGRTTGQLRLFAQVLRDGTYQDTVIEHAEGARPDLRRINRPIGPVAVFAASNFPFAFSVAGGDTASALAAGCPVIVKAHEAHPRTSKLTAELVLEALADVGAPRGVFGIVFGREAGAQLVQQPAIAGVGFTGSARGGLALAKLCAERPDPIPFYGELGSTNPVIVLPGAVSARGPEIAAGYAGSLTLAPASSAPTRASCSCPRTRRSWTPSPRPSPAPWAPRCWPSGSTAGSSQGSKSSRRCPVCGCWPKASRGRGRGPRHPPCTW